MGFNGQCLVQVLSSLNMPVEYYKEVLPVTELSLWLCVDQCKGLDFIVI